MDFLVKKGDLLKELSFVQGVVERKNTIPILSNLLLEAKGTDLEITATDLDVSIECNCPASIKAPGALALSARKLFDIIRSLPDTSEIHFKSSDKDWVTITCEKSRFKIVGLPRDNFPAIPSPAEESRQLPATVLGSMIARSIFAITQEESRYSLNGALMILKPSSLSMVTTDGHRLVMITRTLEVAGLETEIRALIPKKTLTELAKLASEGEQPIEFSRDENHLFFQVGKRLLVSRVLAGQFPNYELVLPRDNDKTVIASSRELSDALRRASIMADERSRAIKMSVSDGQLEIFSSSADYGEATDSVAVQYNGDRMEIGFNAQYLIEFLNALDDQEVSIHLKDEETQGLFRPHTNKDFDYQYVVMPMKL